MPTSSSSPEHELPPPLPHGRNATPPPASPATFGGVTYESLPTHSSPVKRGQPVVGGRKQVDNSNIVSSPNEDADFLANHLSSIPADFPWRNFIDKEKLEKVEERKPKDGEKSYYNPFSEILTTLSAKIHDSLEAKVKATSTPIVFIPNSKQNLTYHPAGDDPHSQSNYAPDVVGVLGPLEDYERPANTRKSGGNQSEFQKYMAIPYPLVRAVIEMKTASEDGRAQAISYSWYVFEACPHIVGMYVLSVRPQYYQISWVDATGPVSSPRYPLDLNNLAPLASYLYSLYVPPKGHYLFDSTIQPYIPSCNNLTKALVHTKAGKKKPWLGWNVTVGSRVYEGCDLRVWSGGFGRRTTVFWTKPSSADEQGFVIKDLYRDEARRFTEQQMLELVHSDGVVPGVVRILAHEEVKSSVHGGEGTPIRTAGFVTHQGKVARRVRTRLLLGSSGERLTRAKTLSDLLKAIYDTVETHRAMVMERKILHRDVSVNNILLYPRQCPFPNEDGKTKYFVPEKPLRFIDDVLASNFPSNESDPITADTSRCLIIDFDNSSPAHKDLIPILQSQDQCDGNSLEALKPSDVQEALRERTGTPIFISRSVSLGKTLRCTAQNIRFNPMPFLKGQAKVKYIAAYGTQMYDQWCDTDGKMHGGEPPEYADKNADLPFTHKPCHDVESIYWTFLYALIKARPAGAPSEESLPWGVEWVNLLVMKHSIPGKSGNDEAKRSSFLESQPWNLENILHPMLQESGLGDLLFKLAQQISPEYAYLSPPPPVDHLHEAFRRLLLEFIVDLEAHPDKDVALDPDMSRSFAEQSYDAGGSKSRSKRAYEDGMLVLPDPKRTRSSHHNVEGEVNGSRVITESFQRGSSAQRGSRSRS